MVVQGGVIEILRMLQGKKWRTKTQTNSDIEKNLTAGTAMAKFTPLTLKFE